MCSPATTSTLPPGTHGNAHDIGVALYSRYLFPFEITSMVLLVAMVGAIVITRGRRAPGAPSGDAGEGGAS